MIKTLETSQKQAKTKFRIPRSAQDILPVDRVWPDGIFQCGEQFSKSWQFSDINYAISSPEDQLAMFMDYCKLLNALDSGVSAKITINNRLCSSPEEAVSQLLSPPQEDGLNAYRKEYNQLIASRIMQSNHGYRTERYITITVVRRNIAEARQYFARVGTDLATHFAQLSSQATPLDGADRLALLRDFYKSGQPAAAPFDFSGTMRRGHHFKDWFCPQTVEIKPGFLKLDDLYVRTLYLQDYANFIEDKLISELYELPCEMMVSLDLLPIPTDEAVREIQNRLLGVETNITSWQRRQNAANNFSAMVPFDMEQQRTETKEMLSDLTSRDQRLVFGLLTVVLTADSLKQLDTATEQVQSVARKQLCQLTPLTFQQLEGLNTALPYGPRQILAVRTLTTESAAVMLPFHAQEIVMPGGLYYGQNAVSQNIIVADRTALLNGNGWILAASGGGKSTACKNTISQIMMRTHDDILILDPESEYIPLVRAFGGEVITVSATSDVHINLLDMDRDYGENDRPLPEKTEFVLSVFDQLMGSGNVTSQMRSIVGRCLTEVYKDYMRSNYTIAPPTLQDLYKVMRSQPEQEAHDLALSAELISTGPLNVFAHQTNVNTKSRLLSYDIRSLGDQLKPVGMLATLDAILNRVITNWKQGRRTWIFVDEFYLLLKSSYSSEFFYRLWKRIRKYNGLITGITQNVDELLRNDQARLMLANSEFLMLLNQAPTDRDELARLLNISSTQMDYVTNAPAGSGLIKCGGAIVPFENPIPKDSKIYKLITTKPGEAIMPE